MFFSSSSFQNFRDDSCLLFLRYHIFVRSVGNEYKDHLATLSNCHAAVFRYLISGTLRRLPVQWPCPLSILYCSDSPSPLANLPALWGTATSRREFRGSLGSIGRGSC